MLSCSRYSYTVQKRANFLKMRSQQLGFVLWVCVYFHVPTKAGGAECDWTCYLERYADLRDAFGSDEQKAEQHYINSGQQEGRDCTCPGFLRIPNTASAASAA